VAIPQNGLTSYEDPPVFFVSSFLRCLLWCASLLGFTIRAISQNGLTCHESSPKFFVSSFLRRLIRYARLLGAAIYPIPQNGWASYKDYPSFQCHHSATALYGTQASLPSEFLAYLLINPSLYGMQAF